MSESTPAEGEHDGVRASAADGEVVAGRRDVSVYGLRVRSDIELADWPSAAPGEPDVVVRAEPEWTPTFEGSPFTARSVYVDGEVRSEVRGVGRFTATATHMTVAPESGARPEDVRLYVTGAMFGAVLHQRGLFPLHASCVAIDGVGVSFAGTSGSGKSTLVGALLRRGAAFVSDDICVLTSGASGEVRVWPSASRLKLDPHAMTTLDGRPERLEPAGGDRGKFHVPVSAQPTAAGPVPLSRVYLLGFGDGPVRIERLSGLDAISALVDETYVLACAAALGLSQQVFRHAAQAARSLTVSRLIRPRGLDHMDAVVERIRDDVKDESTPDAAGFASA
jgi:hypothetical protein